MASQESHLKQWPENLVGKAAGKAWNTGFELGDKKTQKTYFKIIQNFCYNLPRLWNTVLAGTHGKPLEEVILIIRPKTNNQQH